MRKSKSIALMLVVVVSFAFLAGCSTTTQPTTTQSTAPIASATEKQLTKDDLFDQAVQKYYSGNMDEAGITAFKKDINSINKADNILVVDTGFNSTSIGIVLNYTFDDPANLNLMVTDSLNKIYAYLKAIYHHPGYSKSGNQTIGVSAIYTATIKDKFGKNSFINGQMEILYGNENLDQVVWDSMDEMVKEDPQKVLDFSGIGSEHIGARTFGELWNYKKN